MSCEVMDIGQELQAEELRHASQKHITSVTSLDGQHWTTKEGIFREFRDYFQKLFIKEPELISAQFYTYLADFPGLEAAEAAECDGCITENEIRQILETVGTNKIPGIDCFPYKVYLRLSLCWQLSITTG